MQRKRKEKLVFFILFLCFAMTGLTSFFQIRYYRQTMFSQFSRICERFIEAEPEMEQVLFNVLKQNQKEEKQEKREIKQAAGFSKENNHDFLEQYGYHSGNFLTEKIAYIWIIPALFFLIGSAFFLFFFFALEKRGKERIEELTIYLQKVNFHGTKTMIPSKEDEFSFLQDEIYKTVTNLYQTRDAAYHAKENYADNLANIAHQLKTLISAALLSLQLLKEEVSSVYIEQVQRQLMRLNTLETALLTLAQIDSGTLKLAHQPVDIYTALSLAEDNLYDLLAEKGITVKIPEHDHIMILGDMDWTMEAFLNLIKNCMEHSSRGGTIYCDYSMNPLYTKICIWDEGKGFAKKDLPHLFERFYRGENAENHGIGIGLAIAKSIFTLQNGTITAKNLPEGGACFEIRIYHKRE